MTPGCEDEVVRQLVEMRRGAADYAQRDGRIARDEYFFAEQNARLVRNAERYYRAMFQGRVSSWNLRDTHMAETLDALARFLESEGREPKIVVSAHHSPLRDARPTQLGGAGGLDLGPIRPPKTGEEAGLPGFT